jgi:5-methylcytosine-specific restriction endonuclease McrA
MPFALKTLTWTAKPVTLGEAKRIAERDHYRCQYCGLDGNASFENSLQIGVDFVMPRARRGPKQPKNLVACCRSCNFLKGRHVFHDFESAKEYVLKRRAQLRQAWETRVAEQKKTSGQTSARAS